MLHPGMRTSSIFNTQHVATRRKRVAERAQNVAPNNVALKCCDRLAGACKCWANNVTPCCDMLWSFNRCLASLSPVNDRNILTQHIQTLLPHHLQAPAKRLQHFNKTYPNIAGSSFACSSGQTIVTFQHNISQY